MIDKAFTAKSRGHMVEKVDAKQVPERVLLIISFRTVIPRIFGTLVLNHYPFSLCRSPSIETFRNKLKTNLFRIAFPYGSVWALVPLIFHLMIEKGDITLLLT